MTDTDRTDDADIRFYKIRDHAVSKIERDQNHDTALLAILTNRIIIPSPDAEAIKQAVEDIRKLAEERTQP